MTVSDPTPTPNPAVKCRTVALTPKGHLAAAGYSTPIIEALGGIVWVPVLRPRWYQDKRVAVEAQGEGAEAATRSEGGAL